MPPPLPYLQGTAGGLAVQFSAARHDQYATEKAMGRGGGHASALQLPVRVSVGCCEFVMAARHPWEPAMLACQAQCRCVLA